MLQALACYNFLIPLSTAFNIPSSWGRSGGFKLWECSVDLAQHLCKEYSLDNLFSNKTDPNLDLVGKRVLELGCGHGLPGIVPLLAGADVHFQASPCRYILFMHCFGTVLLVGSHQYMLATLAAL